MSYISFDCHLSTVARKIISDGAFDELLNELAEAMAERNGKLECADAVHAWLSQFCGADLENTGRDFLKAVARFYAEQFPS